MMYIIFVVLVAISISCHILSMRQKLKQRRAEPEAENNAQKPLAPPALKDVVYDSKQRCWIAYYNGKESRSRYGISWVYENGVAVDWELSKKFHSIIEAKKLGFKE